MIFLAIPTLLLLLQISFFLHIYFLFQFVLKRSKRHLTGFVNTAVSNMLIASVLTVLAIYRPDLIREIDALKIFWLMSGVIMLAMLITQAAVMRAIYRKAQQPENYHYNYFGKKVLHPTVASGGEVMIFFFSVPVLLVSGAYFTARLINLLMYGRL
ncbi:MAG: hypothetical protein EPN93_09945 [Spirochaetes bacterium]|nr:MAG: hypothetical protein EPN93_09945 [Spirochaetota bacterium]